MKKLVVTSIMLIAMVTFAMAQGFQRQTPEERAKNESERLEKLLTLTTDQKTKVHAVELELSKEMSDQMQKIQQGDRDAMMALWQSIQKKREEKYKEVMTADQFKKYSDEYEQRMRDMQNRQRPNN